MKQRTRSYTLLLGFLLQVAGWSSFGQWQGASPNGFGSFGGDAAAGSFTGGGLFSPSLSAGNLLLTQGVQQPYGKLIIRGKCITPLQKPIPYVSLNLSGSENRQWQAGLDGKFSLPVGYAATVTLAPSKNNDVVKANGVSTLDILQIQSHILGKFFLNSPYKIIAADADNNGAVSVLDILLIKRLILGLDTSFKGNRLWAFVDSSFVFVNPSNPFPYTASIAKAGMRISADQQTFYGVKIGDVNQDWSASVLGAVKYKTPIQLLQGKPIIDNNLRLKIPVYAHQFTNLLALQFTLDYNAEEYNFIGIDNQRINMEANAERTGKVPMLWAEATNTPQTFRDDEVLFYLLLQPKNNATPNPQLTINSSITQVVAYDKQYDAHSVEWKQAAAETTPAPLVAISPNPTTNWVTVQLPPTTSKQVVLSLATAAGKQLWKKTYRINETGQTLQLPLHQNTHLADGIYYLTISGLAAEATYPIMIQSTK